MSSDALVDMSSSITLSDGQCGSQLAGSLQTHHNKSTAHSTAALRAEDREVVKGLLNLGLAATQIVRESGVGRKVVER